MPLTSELDALYGSNVNPIREQALERVNSKEGSAKIERGHAMCPLYILVDPTGVEPVSENLLI